MTNKSRTSRWIGISTICLVCVLACVAPGGTLTIRDVQYTESADGASPYNGKVVDCAGGIAIVKTGGSRPRLFLQDPNALGGWGAIQVKGWASDAFAGVSVGDWVGIQQVFVEENRGTTFLQYWDKNSDGSRPVLKVASHGHTLPRPLVVDVNEIQAPTYLPATDAWCVPDRRAEKLESMLVQIRNVAVVERDLGKAQDNYALQSFREPNETGALCWASDYLNANRPKSGLYVSGIEKGRRLRAVTGVLEQYTSLADGFDYYQLLTLSDQSVVGLCAADLNADGDVDLWDYKLFIDQLLDPSVPPVGDLNQDGKVDATDLALFNTAWQQADVNGDGIVNGDDLD